MRESNQPTDSPSTFFREFTVGDFKRNLYSRLKEIHPPQMHRQHKRLVEIMAGIYEEVKVLQKGRPSAAEADALKRSIRELANYAATHFKEEERFMESIGFPGLAHHKSIHVLFVDRFTEIAHKIENESITYALDLMFLVVGWLFDHINAMDSQYSRMAKGEKVTVAAQPKPVAPSPPKPAPRASSRGGDSFRKNLEKQLPDVGVARFNRDHRELLQKALAFHDLVDALNKGRPGEREWTEIDRFLSFMGRYTQDHFKAEEAMMRQHQFPRLQEHIREHEVLLKKFGELQNRLANDRNVIYAVDMKFFLVDWLLSHTFRTDLQYRDYFHDKQVK